MWKSLRIVAGHASHAPRTNVSPCLLRRSVETPMVMHRWHKVADLWIRDRSRMLRARWSQQFRRATGKIHRMLTQPNDVAVRPKPAWQLSLKGREYDVRRY